jgi:hypothetical protein
VRGSTLLTRAIQWLRQLPGNGLQHGAGLRENVVVPEANDAPSLLSQIRRAMRISIGLLGMLSAIELFDKLRVSGKSL